MSEAAVNLEMENSIQRTQEKSMRLRPHATNAQYVPKAREFEEWCRGKKFPAISQFTVTEQKLHLFLEECVTGRQRKRDKGKEKVIGYQTVLSYVSAVTDLHKQQKLAGINNFPNPRGDSIKSLLTNVVLENESIRRKIFEDRGKETILDVISLLNDLKMVLILLLVGCRLFSSKKQQE